MAKKTATKTTTKTAKPKTKIARVTKSKAVKKTGTRMGALKPYPAPITDGKPLSVYLVGLGVNLSEFKGIGFDPDAESEFTAVIPAASMDPIWATVAEVNTDEPCIVTRRKNRKKTENPKLAGSGKLTITIRPQGSANDQRIDAVVDLIPQS